MAFFERNAADSGSLSLAQLEVPVQVPRRGSVIRVPKNKRKFGPHTHLTLRDVVDKLKLPQNEYVYSDIDSRTEIRLLHLHKGDFESKLECSLITVSRDSKDEYEALSYFWGYEEAEPRDEIYIYATPKKLEKPGGKFDFRNVAQSVTLKKFYIRPNLAAALRHLRSLDHTIPLWIDAICINQPNKTEKSVQIARMADVYHRATNVIVWLGEAYGKSDLAMDFIPQVLDMTSFDDLVRDPDTKQQWSALADLMTAKWFYRRWIVQELAFAKKATIHCGHKFWDWTDFKDAISLFTTHLDQVKQLYSKDILGHVEAFGANVLVRALSNLFRKTDDGQIMEHLLPLQTLVARLLTFEASNNRDIIYALLSIAKDTRSWGNPTGTHYSLVAEDLLPDYDKSIVDVYVDFIRFCVETSLSIDVICRPFAPTARARASDDANQPDGRRSQMTRRRSSRINKFEKLPSWIPMLADSKFGSADGPMNGRRNADSLVGDPERPNYNASKGINAENIRFGVYPFYSALPPPLSRSQSYSSPAVSNHAALTPATTPANSTFTSGISTPQKPEPEQSKSSKYNGNMYVRGIIIDTINKVSARIAEGVILLDCLQMGGWEEAADGGNDDDDLDYSTAEVPDRLWRTLVANRDSDGADPPTWYQRACLYCLAQRTNTGDINTAALIAEGKSSVIVKFLRRVQDVVWNKRFLSTARKDHFGLAPKKAEPGDLICILFGCSVPVILRPQPDAENTSYELIGEAYVHGIMDGQAVEGLSAETLKARTVEFCLK